jgi:hypothetical protein
MSLVRSSSLGERAKEVSEEWRGPNQLLKLALAYAAVILASFSTHVLLCTMGYLFGLGVAWVV